MKLTGKQRYRQAMLKASIQRLRSIRQADLDQKAGRHWVIKGATDRKCLEAELDRAFEAGLRAGAASERERAIGYARAAGLQYMGMDQQGAADASFWLMRVLSQGWLEAPQ